MTTAQGASWRGWLLLGLLGTAAAAGCTLDRFGLGPKGQDGGAGGASGSSSSSTSASSTGSSGGGGASSTGSSSTSGTGAEGAGAAGASTGGGAAGGAGGQGGGGPVCGNGKIDPPGEECDDGDKDDKDGCNKNCDIEKDHWCKGEPSECGPAFSPDLKAGIPIPDDLYKGGIDDKNQVACASIPVAVAGGKKVEKVVVALAIDHEQAGDLTIKLRAPGADDPPLVTLMSRPGLEEQADDGANYGGFLDPCCNLQECCSSKGALSKDYPVTFDDDAAVDAELMGKQLAPGEVVCNPKPTPCEFFPNQGKAFSDELIDLEGLDPNGTWTICVGDSKPAQKGTLKGATLKLLLTP
ncbi:MAG: hypothetical protein HY744_21785 [Deltaproteobacteria bacterium]|nr:hypothetical protein [Deltaproteobacteria bacterium]